MRSACPRIAPSASVARSCRTLEDRQSAPSPPGVQRSRSLCGSRQGEALRWARLRAEAVRRPATAAALAWVAPLDPAAPPTRRDWSRARGHSTRSWRGHSLAVCAGAGVSHEARRGTRVPMPTWRATPYGAAAARADAGPVAPGPDAGSQEGRTSGTSGIRPGYVAVSRVLYRAARAYV